MRRIAHEAAAVTVRCEGGEARVVLDGEFDIATAGLVADALRDVSPTVRRVVVDCRAVAFADCALLRVLLPARDTLVLLGPLPSVMHRLLTHSGTRKLFAVLDPAVRLPSQSVRRNVRRTPAPDPSPDPRTSSPR
ncbi:STAS domain-containing protein [Streptomyces genisteinicus]|uniref:STAS domain-containing protein n=1 Tax=Streptomyces genisteinicus TaxID=2768068 RepID=A0A7H0HM88_9ACTN|nr:STAS domain-containing protein [Streptomyces genisteinicus]QNP61654.1 STAS domain-containing protein [Streptomyces genisteinicus]